MADGEKNVLGDDFRVEYAKSNRSSCRACKQKIEKDSVRFGIKEVSDKFDGEIDTWHHAACFFKKKPGTKVSQLKGFSTLRPNDQPKIKKFCGEETGEKRKAKEEDEEDEDEKKPKKKQKKGEKEEKKEEVDPDAKKIWEMRDLVIGFCTTKDMKEILDLNKQYSKGGKEDLALRIADGIVKGALPQCPECKNGALSFSEGKYKCKHHATEWSRCTYAVSYTHLTLPTT
eukprot:TRINITY_DN410_c0_g2_i2.p1 TRINITY_DN410_c0_g2~~TRINITY_DN410_c0_g2_i2.p1  ORF type:complete len:229 (+),score=82.45 TRINITY_DN410_c0_g2_i2:35-721(+)